VFETFSVANEPHVPNGQQSASAGSLSLQESPLPMFCDRRRKASEQTVVPDRILTDSPTRPVWLCAAPTPGRSIAGPSGHRPPQRVPMTPPKPEQPVHHDR
jgi:hypothetical protein